GGGDVHHGGGFFVLHDAVTAEHGELVAQGVDGHVERVAGFDAAIGPYAQGEAVEVGLLTYAGVLHAVRHAPNGRVDGVHGDGVDAVLGAVDLGGNVAHAALHAHFHHELGALGEGGHVKVGVHDLGVGRHVERGSGYLSRRLGPEGERDGVVVVHLHHEVLEVEDDLHDVLFDPVDGGELV